MDSRKKIIRQLEAFKRKIKNKYDVQKMIVFGSFAKGYFTKDSDIDVILVSDKFGGQASFERSPPFWLEWNLNYPVDFLCYTPEEFRKKSRMVSIVREAVKTGLEV